MMCRVVAPLVLVRDELGRTHHAYEGSVVDINVNHATYLLAEGMVVASDEDSPNVSADPVVDVDDGAEVGAGDPGADLPSSVSKPQHVAPKARWVDYAVSQGFNRDEAESMSKAALIESLK